MKRIPVVLLLLPATAAWAQSGPRSADVERVQTATTILSQIMEAPDQGNPRQHHVRREVHCDRALDAEGQLYLRRQLRQGRGHLPHRHRLEHPSLLPHQRRQLRLSGGRTGF